MNQDFRHLFFSHFIATCSKIYVKGNFWGNFSFSAIKRSKKVNRTKRPDGFTKMFPKWLAAFWRLVVLNIAAFMHQWVFRGEGFGSKYKSYFTWEMAQEIARCAAGIICSFFVVFCPLSSLQRSVMKLKIIGTASFLAASWRSFKDGPNKLITKRFCLKLSSVKCFTQTRECFEGMKHFLFIFISHWPFLC